MKRKEGQVDSGLQGQNKIVWIYESPDKGKTVYRRPFGKVGPKELVKGIDLNKELLKNINLN